MWCMLYILTLYGTMVLDKPSVPCDLCPDIGTMRTYDSEEFLGYVCKPIETQEG